MDSGDPRSPFSPDPRAVERCRSAPEVGPRIVFFSGGTALRPLSRKLKELTHNSVHIVTPFDSGGSSAKLRAAFGMPAVGDLRNRLMALADETELGNPATYALFSHRLAESDDGAELRADLREKIDGHDPLVEAVAPPFRRVVRAHLRHFADHMPEDFDLRGASIGNLVLAGGYLHNDRDLHAVLSEFSQLVAVRGCVMPVVEDNLHLAARLSDGSELVGQHRITNRAVDRDGPRITDLRLVRGLEDPSAVACVAQRRVLDLIRSADLIVLPMGSFWTSIVANLLPSGVGGAIAGADCPKVYIPNAGRDPEQQGMTTQDCTGEIRARIAADAGEDVDLAVLPGDRSAADLAALLVSLA